MSDATDQDGRTAIVTGAASGIGEATVRVLARDGLHVVGIVRDVGRARHLQDELGEQFCAVAADLAQRGRAGAAVASSIAAHGRVHVLVTCAGVGARAPLAETSDEQYDAMFSVNVRSVFEACRAVIPHMLEHGGGTIVNVASSLAAKAARDRAIYATTKNAVVGMTRSIAVDYGTRGIRANCVSPGTTDTPWIGRILAGAPNEDELRAQMAARQAIGRLGRAEEIAEVIGFLASERASFVHGAAIAVDGGQTAW